MDSEIRDLRCDLASEGAEVGLLALMTGISEEAWAASWLSGLEFSLWKIEPGANFGMMVITERQSALLHLLSSESGGWWHWPEGSNNPKFISLDKWDAVLETLPAPTRKAK